MPRRQEDELQRQLGADLINQAIGIRNRRRTVEQRWLNGRRAWMNLFIDRRYLSTDTSPANYSIPAARRAAERTIVRGVSLLTPNVKWFEVQPMSDVQGDKLANVDQFMWYVLRKKIRSRSNINLLVRSMYLYGLCHLKTGVAVKNGMVWPTQRVIDPFAYYIFPETAATADEAEIQFEDYLWSFEKYNAIASLDTSPFDKISRTDLLKPDWPYHLTERLAYSGISDPTADVETAARRVGESLDAIGAGFVSMTEMSIPKNDKMYQVFIVNNLKGGAQITGFVQSAYDEPLIRTVVHRPLAGETYTNSMMDDTTELNTIQNDFINQFFEAADFEQGFVAFNNAEMAGARKDTFRMKGRAKWELGDDPRNAMQFMQPNIVSPNLLRAWQIASGLINSLAGTGTIAEGQPGRNMPRAGGAVNNLITLSMADIQDVAELIEQEVLTPSLGDIYKASSQFIPESQLMRIPGGTALYNGQRSSILKRDDIKGDYEFEWVGSLQFQDENLRSQRLMIFLQMMPQLAPFLQQQGYAPNMVELVKMIWRYGLGERGLSKVVVPVAELQQIVLQDQQESQAKVNGSNGSSLAKNGVPGLSYNLPTVSQGFVTR